MLQAPRCKHISDNDDGFVRHARQDLVYLHATCWTLTGFAKRGKPDGMQQDMESTLI